MHAVEPAKRGRKRSEASRVAILDAAFAIAREGGYAALTMDGLAERAGVGKQTIYRWWRSRAEVAVDALLHRASDRITVPDRGTLRADLTAFLRDTFATARAGGTAELLRGLAAEAQLDPEFRAGAFRTFVGARREVLGSILARARARGERVPDPEVAADVAFGVLWYRLLVSDGSLDDALARKVARVLVTSP